MFETHTTSSGDTMLICQMDNRHLSNIIRLLCKEIEKSRKILTQPQVENELIAVFNPSYSQSNLKANAERHLKQCHAKLQPYLAEAFLRKMFYMAGDVQTAYGRNEAVANIVNVTLKLPAVDDSDDWEIDDESDTSHPGHPIHYGDR